MPLNLIRPLGNGKFQTPNGVFDSYQEAAMSVGMSPQFGVPASPALNTPSYGTKLEDMAQDSLFGFNPRSSDIRDAKLMSSPMPIAQPKSPGIFDAPVQDASQGMAQSEPTLLDKLTSKQGIGAIGAGLLAMSQSPNLQRFGLNQISNMQKKAEEEKALASASAAKNRTIEELRKRNRGDLADAVESGLLGATDAAKLLFSKTELPAEIRTAQWYLQNPEEAAKLKELGLIGKSGITINTGDATPAKPATGTQLIKQDGVYTQVPMYGSNEANQVQQAIVTAQNTLDVIDKTLADKPGLAAAVGPVDARTPSFGADATRFESYHNQLKGKAFLQAFESLKGGGQITEIEGQKAEQAISRLNLALNEKDYVDALNELRQVVEAGLRRSKDQWSMIPKPEGTQSANNDPLGIR